MKSFLFHCHSSVDSVDAFAMHLKNAAQRYEAQHKCYVPVDFRDQKIYVGVEGGHSYSYSFISTPRLESRTIILEGKIEKESFPIPYSNRKEKALILAMGITIYVGFWLPILISAAVRSCLRRRLLKRFMLIYAGCIIAK